MNTLSLNIKRFILIAAVSLCAFFVSLDSAQALFDMTATQVEGGYDLRFGRVEPTDVRTVRQMTLRVNTDIGKLYRVFQQLIQPLTTPQGQALDPGQFQMYALQGSNMRGALIYQQEQPVTQSQTLLYTSDQAGNADSFQIVYIVRPKEDQVPGSYYGRLSLILVPIDGTQSQVVVNVQIYVELTAGSAAFAEILTATGSDRLSINSRDIRVTSSGIEGVWPQVLIKVNGPLGRAYRVYQTLERGEVVSSDGYSFDLGAVTSRFEGGRRGSLLAERLSLKEARQKKLIYTSDPNGASDEIVVTYVPGDDFRLLRSGLYRGRLVVSVEEQDAGGVPRVFKKTFDLVFDIAPLFDIRVYSQGTEGVALRFGDVNYKTGPKTSETEIFVESNLGKSYKVVQRAASLMVSDQAEKIPPEDFVMRVKDVEVREDAALVASEFKPVQEGESVIFASGPSGDSANFRVEYRLTMKPDTRAGNYNTRIGYSLVLD